MTLGIDISHYSGTRDWRCLTDLGIAFAFIKASEGATLKDDVFDRNWAAMHEAGIPCGAYHFAHPGRDAETQAAFFCSAVGKLAPTDLQPVLDLEVGDGLAPDQIVDWTLAFLNAAEATLQTRFIIYTGGFWRRTLGNPDCAPLGQRKLWTARYGDISPVLPRPWNAWTIWQFSDNIHSAPPEAKTLKCSCDWNRLADGVTVADLTVSANATVVPPPSPQPGDDWPGRVFIYPATPPVEGDDVRRWQARMVELGWPLEQDGYYGPISRWACESLQCHLGLVTDGIVGRKTWQATFAPRVA